MDVVSVLEGAFWSYAGIGAVFGVAFVAAGAAAIDPAAAAAPWSVRIVWWPGAVALWPWLIRAWRRARRRS